MSSVPEPWTLVEKFPEELDALHAEVMKKAAKKTAPRKKAAAKKKATST